MPSSRVSSGPGDRTHICISCIAGGFFAAEPPVKPRDELFSAPNPDFSVPLASLCVGRRNSGWITGLLGFLGSLSSQQWEASERQGEETENARIILALGKITLAAELTFLKVTAVQIQ